MRFHLALIVLGCSLALNAARGDPLQRSLAITDPRALRELDRSDAAGFGLGRMLDPARGATLSNAELFALLSMAPVRRALDGEFERYVARHRAILPNETIGVSPAHDFQLFDRTLLTSADTRFVLAGIVNRMDRAYLAPETCGEV